MTTPTELSIVCPNCDTLVHWRASCVLPGPREVAGEDDPSVQHEHPYVDELHLGGQG